MAAFETDDIASRAKRKLKEPVTVSDISAFILEEICGDKDTAYSLTKSKEPLSRAAVKSSSYAFFRRSEVKKRAVMDEVRPYLNGWISEYVSKRYDEFEPFLVDLQLEKNPVDPTTLDPTVYDDTVLSDAYLRRLLQKVIAKIDGSQLDKDMIASAVQTIKLLKDKFDTKDEDNKIVIEIPSPFTGVCPHCQHEV